ncbi:MAG: lysoplasmalogenase [Thermodesulfobacteriota bacterium]
MIDILILTAAAVLLGGLLYFEKRESMRGRVLTKPVLSALFVAVALTGPRTDPSYFGLVLAGLSFCMAGDVFLLFFSSKRLFLAGLVSFLTGHVLYTIAFFTRALPGMPTWIAGACGLAVSGAVFAWLRPHLGRMLIPVVAYMAVITVMVIGAASLMGDEKAGFSGRALAFSGALLFYGSDIFVARQQFVASQYVNRLVGLPLYYAAQFMIAFSIRLL